MLHVVDFWTGIDELPDAHNRHTVVTTKPSTFTVSTVKKECFVMTLPCMSRIQSLPSRVEVNESVIVQAFTHDKVAGMHCFLNV